MNMNPREPKLRKFIEKIRRGYPFWFTFITTPRVEPTNNCAERALRELCGSAENHRDSGS